MTLKPNQPICMHCRESVDWGDGEQCEYCSVVMHSDCYKESFDICIACGEHDEEDEPEYIEELSRQRDEVKRLITKLDEFIWVTTGGVLISSVISATAIFAHPKFNEDWLGRVLMLAIILFSLTMIRHLQKGMRKKVKNARLTLEECDQKLEELYVEWEERKKRAKQVSALRETGEPKRPQNKQKA